MTLWRLSRYPALDGTGGLIRSARWHTKGRRVVYTATSPPGALVEVLVNLDLEPGELPEDYHLIGLDVQGTVETLDVQAASLPDDWRDDLFVTRAVGDDWLARGTAALLRVPCSVIDKTSNVLIAPDRIPSGALRVIYDEVYPFDQRLL